MKMNVSDTVKSDTCINCGICKVVCKFNAIIMKRNRYGEINPCIDNKKCKNCGVCLKYCPNSKEKFQNLAKKLNRVEYPHTYGLQNANYYVAWNDNKILRQRCCSGGAVTTLASYLFESGKIDGMIHVTRLWGNVGDLHYEAVLSSSIEEIQENVSSAYQPIDFSDILSKLKKGKTYFMTGTPCVIRGIKYLLENNRDFSEINIITCALICSHNINTQFVDYFLVMNGITGDNKHNTGIKKYMDSSNKDKWQVNFRSKDDNMLDANNFKNHIYTRQTNLINKNRFESGWTEIWRSYYFAMGACLKCPDFWGNDADISVKDAWGKWADDPLGKSIVVIRNKNTEQEFLKSGIIYERLDWDTIKDHQNITSSFKQSEAYNKNFSSFISRSNRKNGMFKYFLISKCSKFFYGRFGYRFTKLIMPFIEKFGQRIEKI